MAVRSSYSARVWGGASAGVPSPPATGTNYFVSNTGDDSKDGLNGSNAWETIAKVNASSFDPGDTVAFEKGGVWRETLTVPSTGTAEGYITFTSYGAGDDPRILGSNVSTGWSDEGGNVWSSDTALTDPYGATDMEVWFEEIGGDITWGTQQTYVDLSELTQEYDWCWNANVVYVFAATDPDARYTSVEVPQRVGLIDLNANQYITVDGLELAYGVAGVGEGTYPTPNFFGLTVKNCHIHHLGTKDGAGYGVNACTNDMLIEDNEIHDCGRRGLSIYNYGVSNISNIIIQGNEIYNGFHTTAVDCNAGSVAGANGNISDVIVRSNLMYDTSDRPVSEGSAQMNFISGDGSGSGEVTDLDFYNNIVKYVSEQGVLIEDATRINIYNNTFYGHNTTIAASTNQIQVTDGSLDILVKNNIFYTLLNFTTNGAGKGLNEGGAQDHTEIDADYNLYYRIADDLRIIFAIGTNYYRTVASFDAMNSATGWESNSPYPADPTFTNEGADNYHLQTGSPAIGAGVAIAGYTTDYEGVSVSNPPNIGAFETTEDP